MHYDEEAIDQISIYVTKLFIRFQTADLLYHNLNHTHSVVKRAGEIAVYYSPDAKFSFCLSAAAWFHDTGYLFGPAADHEERSNLIMRGYLQKTGVEESTIRTIEQSILSTRSPYKPISLLDEILCDADSYYLGTDQFIEADELLKKEFELRNHYLPKTRDEKTLALLETHIYFTPYCRALLQKVKQKNIETLRSKIYS